MVAFFGVHTLLYLHLGDMYCTTRLTIEIRFVELLLCRVRVGLIHTLRLRVWTPVWRIFPILYVPYDFF